MPIYEYQCPSCGKVFEEWSKASDSHKEEACPVCGAASPRIMSRTSFVLKGDGWYVSDYGYRKGISEDSGGKADAPLPATPTKPAKQGEKALAKVPDDKADGAGGKTGAPASETSGAATGGSSPAKADAPSKNAQATDKAAS